MENSKAKLVALTLVILMGAVFAWTYKETQLTFGTRIAEQQQWKETACPSLLSITRTWRDTLIVMKVEPACNAYVMETFK